MTQLPIDQNIPELLESICSHQNTLLHAPPGAGKSTRVPLALLSIISAEAGRIVMLEPRRIAAVSVARWMAKCLGEEVGQTVGYSIRFEKRTSPATRIEVVTEGILTRRVQNDPTLEGVAMIIFDEFHERSLHAELGLALCRDVQRQLRPDLKMLIMSATLDIAPLSRLLVDAPLVSSAGKSYPVNEIYLEESGHDRLPQRMAAAILRIVKETGGDILAFLPGSGEIRSCSRQLAGSAEMQNILILPLYGDLPFTDQQKAIQPGGGRKIVLATSIAETSITIEGVRVVVDGGMSRRMQFDPSSGMNRLITVRESRASAGQRMGRAGRTAPGICYRLFSRHTLNAMVPHSPPEILTTDLSPLLLELAAWGVADPSMLDWLDNPPAAATQAARDLLIELDAVDEKRRITPLGHELVRLPLHPRLARLVLRSRELLCQQLGCDLAALLSERDIFRSTGNYGATSASVGHSDIVDRVEALQRWRSRSGREAADRLDHSALLTVERVAGQLTAIVGGSCSPQNPADGNELVARLLLAAYPDRIARRRPGGDGYLLANGRGAILSPRCSVRNAEFIIAAAVDAGTQADVLIHSASEVSGFVLRAERAEHITRHSLVSWNDREGRVIASRQEQLGSITLSSETFIPTDEQLVPVVTEAIRNSRLALLTMNEAVRQLQGRMKLVRSAFPEKNWPDVTDRALLDTLEEWLAPHCSCAHNTRKLAQIDIAALLKQQLDFRQQRELGTLVPTHLAVPSGSLVRLDYGEEAPVLAVKLQELFGLAEGPTVCEGRTAVVLHLLSPAGRPLQVTRDLKGFWDGSYQQVKKELKGRYPKHPWPDDPWSAVPTRRVKSKM